MILSVIMVLGLKLLLLVYTRFHVAVASTSIRFIHRLTYFLANYLFRLYFML